MSQTTTAPATFLSDRELLTRYALSGDQQAFAAIIDRHGSMVLRLCRRVNGGDAHAAEDAAQQVFLALASHANALQNRASLAGWLYRTAWNVTHRQRRNHTTRTDHEARAAEVRGTGAPDGAGDEPVPFAVITAELSDALTRALGTLPETYRDALVLHHIVGQTVEETARIMGVKTGTAASWLSRGRVLLRDRLEDLGIAITIAVAGAWLCEQAAADLDACDVGSVSGAQAARSTSRRRVAFGNAGSGAEAGGLGTGSVLTSVSGASAPGGAVAPMGAGTLFGIPRAASIALGTMLAASSAVAGGAATLADRPHVREAVNVIVVAANVAVDMANDADDRNEPPFVTTSASRNSNNWPRGSASAVPEPSCAFMLVSAGGLGLLRRQGRRKSIGRS